MNGKYVGYVAGHDPLHDFLSKIIRDLMDVREPRPAFRVFRLSGSNVVYAYEEKFSGVKIICKFYGPRFAPDWDKAAGKARQEYEGLETLRRYHLIGSPHHVIRPLGFSRDINGVLAVEYYSGEEFSHAIARATLPPGRRAPVLAAEGARLLPRHPAQPDGQRDPGRFRCGLPLLRHGHGPAQENPPHRAVRPRRALILARPLAGPAADVAGPAGLAARRRDSGELPVRRRHGRRGDRPGTHEARGPDVRRRAGRGRAPARIHARCGRQAPRRTVHRAFPLGIQLSFPRSPARLRVDYGPRCRTTWR